MHFSCFLLFILPLTVCSLFVQAQNTTDRDAAFTNIEAYYQHKITDEAFLFTGKQYSPYEAGLIGTPFYKTDKMQKGDIFYDGNLYRNVPMLFDNVRQQVIINNYQHTAWLQLLSEKVKYFVFDGYRFERFDIFSNPNETAEATNAFYEIMFAGKTSVLVKREKIIKKGKKSDNPNFRSAPDFFIENDAFFIKNNNKLYPVSGKKDVINSLEDKKSSVKNFIRKNHLRFKKDFEKDLVTTAAYYSSLN
jgi:hypothetical protein